MKNLEVKSLTTKLLQEPELEEYHETFLYSVLARLMAGNKLTFRQNRFIFQIENYYSEHEKQQRKKWITLFQDLRQDFLVVARYYRDSGYYTHPSRMALDDETFIPTQKLYDNMCRNKYARRVIEEHHKEPKFSVSDKVYTIKSYLDKGLLRRGGFVLKANAGPITSACKGAKKYLVLPIGNPHALIFEERWLKRRK